MYVHNYCHYLRNFIARSYFAHFFTCNFRGFAHAIPNIHIHTHISCDEVKYWNSNHVVAVNNAIQFFVSHYHALVSMRNFVFSWLTLRVLFFSNSTAMRITKQFAVATYSEHFPLIKAHIYRLDVRFFYHHSKWSRIQQDIMIAQVFFYSSMLLHAECIINIWIEPYWELEFETNVQANIDCIYPCLPNLFENCKCELKTLLRQYLCCQITPLHTLN